MRRAALLFAGLVAASVAGKREWRLIAGAHWQIVSTEIEQRDVTDAREGTRGTCPLGMVSVAGKMIDDDDLELLQDARRASSGSTARSPSDVRASTKRAGSRS